MPPAGVKELDLDRGADAARLDRAVEQPAITRGRLGRGRARGLARRWLREHSHDVRPGTWNVGPVGTKRIQARHVDVRDRGGRGLDRGFAGILNARVHEHAVLHEAQADDRDRAHADEGRRDHERLTTLTAHGVHSMRRDALAVTTNRGSPTNPSGTGSE